MGNKPSYLKSKEMDELTSMTSFNEKQIHDWYVTFTRENPSKKMKVDAFKQTYSKQFPHGDASAFAEHVFRIMDKNEDKRVDFKEFILALNVNLHGTLEDKLKWAFSLYDVDGTGAISKSNMSEIVKDIYTMVPSDGEHERKTEEIFELMDSNEDGYITFGEFHKAVKDNPAILENLTSLKKY